MVNKNLILYILFFLFGCTNNSQKDKPCSLINTALGKYVFFQNFNDGRISEIIFYDLSSSDKVHEYNYTNLENNGDNEMRLRIDENISTLLEKGCIIMIDNSLKYTISEVKIEEIKKTTMSGRRYFCELKGYKLNDSIINSSRVVVYRTATID